MEISFKQSSHIDEKTLFEIVEEKASHYQEKKIPIIIIRKNNLHSYSINPILFIKHTVLIEKHAKWIAMVSPNQSGFENLEYLRQMTEVPAYAFTDYEQAIDLLNKN